MIERAPAVVVDTVGNARTRKPDGIAMIIIGNDAILRERKLLDHRCNRQLPGAAIRERALEVSAAKALLGERPHCVVRRTHRPRPSAIMELHAKRPVIGSPIARARRLNTRCRERTSIWP